MEDERNAIENEVKLAGEKLEYTPKKLKEATAEIKEQKLKAGTTRHGGNTFPRFGRGNRFPSLQLPREAAGNAPAFLQERSVPRPFLII